MKLKRTMKRGSELKVGDLIEFWRPGDMRQIVAVEPYTGSFQKLLGPGTQTITMQPGNVKMTAPHVQWNFVVQTLVEDDDETL